MSTICVQSCFLLKRGPFSAYALLIVSSSIRNLFVASPEARVYAWLLLKTIHKTEVFFTSRVGNGDCFRLIKSWPVLRTELGVGW